MSTDIDLHIEIKLAGDDQWHHYSHPSVMQHYGLFYALAGVRGEERDRPEGPIQMGRGLPDDVTTLTRYNFNRTFGHSVGYIEGDELKLLDEWVGMHLYENDSGTRMPLGLEDVVGYVFGNPPHYATEDKDIDAIRFVFWFDC